MNNRFTLASLPRTQRGQPLVLGASPDGSKFIYCHGHSVIIRELDSPQYADVYTQHAVDVLCAKFSPSGFYIASADKSGKVRIWDTVNKEHILKNEFQPISGPIKDLAWSPDNQRIVVVGEGREKFGHVFLADTGTSNGDISGQSRPINSCDFRPARPFRIVTGSEDNTAAVYEGPPFKFKTAKSEHSRYCQVVRYAPDASTWASAGFDGRVFLYEGKDSELIGEIGDPAHSGGVYGLSYAGDGKSLVTASGDKSVRVWDVESRRILHSIVIGESVEDQQLGCIWMPKSDVVLSVSLSGNINYVDAKKGVLVKVIEGHNKPITTLTVVDSKSAFTGSGDGRLIKWDTEKGEGRQIRGENAPDNQINAMTWNSDHLVVAGIDDCLRKAGDEKFDANFQVKLSSQPRGLAVVGRKTFAVTVNSIIAFENGEVVAEKRVDFEPGCVAGSDVLNHVAVGNDAMELRVYDVNSLDEVKVVKLSGALTSAAYSADSKLLVVGDSNRKVTLFNAVDNYEKANNKEWGFHTAKVTCVAFSPDCKWVASGGLDCSVIIWSVEAPAKHHVLLSAHVQSQITSIKWLDNKTVMTSGQDANVKIWNVTWTP